MWNFLNLFAGGICCWSAYINYKTYETSNFSKVMFYVNIFVAAMNIYLPLTFITLLILRSHIL